MEQLHNFFNIPHYYKNLISEIYSENLMPLFRENPIDYLRHIYSTDSKLFYNVRDELVLRGIGFQPVYQNNYLLDRKYEIKHIIYKKDNTHAFKKINFAVLEVSNFIERFNVRSDLFFKNMPLEGVLHYTRGVSFEVLQKLFKEAGFLIIPVSEYMATQVYETGMSSSDKEEVVSEQKEIYEEEKTLEELSTNDSSMLHVPVRYFYEDSIFVTFLEYCQENNIHSFSELALDFVENYKHQKHVRKKTAEKVLERYHEIHQQYSPLQLAIGDMISLLQNNSFKTIVEFIESDYLNFINDFYSADGVEIYQENFPFERVQQVMDSADKMLAEKKQQQFNQLIGEIENHPKFNYILSYSLAELQEIFEVTWDNSLDLQLYLVDVLDDLNYKDVLGDILVGLNELKDIQQVLEKVTSVLKPRELEVLELRQTKTLQEVGDALGVTRERARQIEGKGRKRLVDYTEQMNLKLYFQYCTEYSKLLTLGEFMQAFEIEGSLYETLLNIFFDIDNSITHLDDLERYILTSDYEVIHESIENIDYSQPIMEVDELKQLFNEDIFDVAQEVVDLLIQSHNFKRVKSIYVKETISIIARINYLFKHVIRGPLEMDNDGYELFKQYMEDTFDISFDSNKRSTTSRIAAGENVILVDSNTFALHNDEAITDDFLAKVEQVIDERLAAFEYVDPRWVFKEYAPLMQEIGLHSPVHLYSIIQLYLDDKYETGHGNTLYIYAANAESKDAETILLNYLRANGHEAKREKVLEELNWKDFKLDQLIPRLKTVVIIGNNIVKTIESFHFRDKELSELKDVIETELQKGYVFIYDLQFELAFNEKLESLIQRSKLTDEVTLASIIKWLYPNIHGHSKLLYWSDSSITKIEQAIYNEFSEFISRNELLEFVESKGYSQQTIHRLPTDILKDGLFYNYTKTKYINAQQLAFTDEVKQSLVSFLEKQFETKVYCSIFSLAGYTQVLAPISSYEWTEYLITHFAEKVGYRKIQTHNDYRFDKPVLVKSDLPIENYEQLIQHIVRTEYKGRYHEEDLAKYLVSKKISHNPRRLTNEIYNSSLFKFDSFGFFEMRGENYIAN